MNPQGYWWPVARSSALSPKKVLARTLCDTPLAIFRDSKGQAQALLDLCPHRLAPLSQGRVVGGQLQCPYHGWRFDGAGRCTRLPGLPQFQTSQRPLCRTLSVQERDGLIWVCLAPAAVTPEPALPTPQNQALHTFWVEDHIRCSVQDAAENFLDGFHTHYVHAGWLRNDRLRQNVKTTVTDIPLGVEAVYSGEQVQSGLITRFLEPVRGVSIGRFRLPGIAEVEYRGRQGLTLLITAWLTPVRDDELQIIAAVSTARGYVPAVVKQLILKPLFGILLRQDKQIVERVHTHKTRFGTDQMPLDAATDLLGPHIRRLLLEEQGLPPVHQERWFSL